MYDKTCVHVGDLRKKNIPEKLTGFIFIDIYYILCVSCVSVISNGCVCVSNRLYL